MYTAMAVVALTLSVTSGNISPAPTWLDDYQVAQARVADAGKPMVVVIGSGQAGWQDAVRGGGFDPAVAKLLADKFVCLYADTATAKGRQLANALQVRQGVVISDKSGRNQAFNASGTVSRTELMSALVRYADQPEIVRTEIQTTTTQPGTVTTVPSGTVAPVPAGTVIQTGPMGPGGPVYMSQPMGAPVMAAPMAGGCGQPGYAMGGYASGGYGMGGGCGMGGRGGCCGMGGGMFGGKFGGWGGGYSSGCGGGGCCGSGGKFGGMFGGMFGGGGWGGGYGGGYGSGGCCH
jgi:hypothetical protein